MKKLIIGTLAVLMLMGGVFCSPVRKSIACNSATICVRYPNG